MSDATPMSDDDLRQFARDTRDAHTPSYQTLDDLRINPYERCALCHFTRHPCDTYDLAAAVLALLDRLPAQDTEGRIIITKTGRLMTEGELTALAEEALRHE